METKRTVWGTMVIGKLEPIACPFWRSISLYSCTPISMQTRRRREEDAWAGAHGVGEEGRSDKGRSIP